MSDDWRLRIDLHEQGHAHTLIERLEAIELKHDLGTSFDDRVVVWRDGTELFFYAGTRDQAERAEQMIRALASEHGWHVDSELRHWHPSAEDWEDPDKPLPESDAERARERAVLMQREREESEARGYPEFEVRIRCRSHREALEFADRLRGEGVPSVQRSRYLLVGTVDEDSANALAARVRGEAPTGSVVAVEGTQKALFAGLPPNPFAILGGLGG